MRALVRPFAAAWLSLVVSLPIVGCSEAPADPTLPYVNSDGELIPPDDDGKDDSPNAAIERALIDRDGGVVGAVQLSYRSAMLLATEVGTPCDDSAVVLTAIARQESTFRVKVVSAVNGNGTVDYGVWQINSRTGQEFGYTAAALKTAHTNAEAMMTIEAAQGLRAWASYTSGRYKKFLPYAQEAFDTYGCR